MAELFDTYESEYQSLSQGVSRKITEIPGLTGEQRKDRIRAAESELLNAQGTLEQMDLEAKSNTGPMKNAYSARLRNYRSDFAKLQSDLRSARTATGAAMSASRAELLGSGYAADDAADDQRSRLLGGTQSLEQSSTRLRESHRVALETEAIGESILSDLHHQRGQLENTRDTLRTAGDNVDRSNRILRAMNRRVITNKFITMLIIAVLVATLIAIVYFAWIK